MHDFEASIKVLQNALKEYNLSFDDVTLSRLLEYQVLLIEKNKELNLTRIDDWNTSLYLNLVDSLLLYRAFESTEGRFLDIGTGAGLPGIPLSIVSSRPGVLMDSVKKKIDAVNGFIDELDLQNQLKTTSERAEIYVKKHRASFDCVVARAVAQSDVLLEYARPYLPKGGSTILTKGNISQEEIQNAEVASRVLGYKLVSRETYELPNGMGHREIFRYEVTKPSSIKLPRTNGEAKRKPVSLTH